MQNELWVDAVDPGCFVWLQVFDSRFHLILGELSREVGVSIEEPPIADQLHYDGVGSDMAEFWFCCLAGQLIDGLLRSSAGVGEVN